MLPGDKKRKQKKLNGINYCLEFHFKPAFDMNDHVFYSFFSMRLHRYESVERNLNFNHHFNCGFVRQFGQVDLLISKSISLFANHLLCFAFISNLIALPILHSNLRDSLFLPLPVSVHYILSLFTSLCISLSLSSLLCSAPVVLFLHLVPLFH